jgi:cytosine/adenosine deaminase-related metal-dependent hydrolase
LWRVRRFDVLGMVTANTARVIVRHDQLGQLAPGREADIAGLRVDEGSWKKLGTWVAHAPLPEARIPGMG